MATYKVKSGDTLMDVCYNTTGSLRAINDIMNANGFDTYTPQLEAGRIIEVPDVVYNSEAVSVADARPFNSASLPFDNLSMQMGQLEFMLGDVGSIIYTFDRSKIAGKYLSLNADNTNEGYVNWGDGTPVEYIKTDGLFGHNYAAGTTTGEVVVTFLGTSQHFGCVLRDSGLEVFKEALIKVDLTNADAACPSGMWNNGFFKCIYLTEVVGSFAGKPNIKDCNSMFMNCWRLASIPPQMFRGCPQLDDAGSCFEFDYQIKNVDYLFADCPNLRDAHNVVSYVYIRSAVGAFQNCPTLTSVVNLFKYCIFLTDVTNVFKGCTNIKRASYVFQNCAVLNPPVNVFDDCKKIYDFKEGLNNLPAATNESPYTVVNGQKVHLWERTAELGFTVPQTYDHCFSDSPTFADYANIPEAWGGPPKTENNVKLRCWPMMAQIVADPTTMAGVVYLNGEILGYNVVEKDTSDRLVIYLPLPTAITSVAGLYVVFYSENDVIIGGSLALADNVAAPTEGAVYETYYNAGYGDNLPSIYPVFAPNNYLTPGIINSYFQPTYNVHIPSLGDFEVVGSESVADVVEITLQITELGWSYYLSSGSDLWIDMQQKLEIYHGIALSALAEEGCTLALSVAIEGYVLTAPAIKFNTMRGSIMPILDFTYVP